MKFSQLKPRRGNKDKFAQAPNAVVVQKNIFGASNPDQSGVLGKGVLGKMTLAKEN